MLPKKVLFFESEDQNLVVKIWVVKTNNIFFNKLVLIG